MTILFLFSFFFLLTLGQLQRLQITPNIAIYLHDLLLVCWCGLTYLTQTTYRQRLISTLRRMCRLPEGLFLIWAGLGLVMAGLHQELTLTAVFYICRLTLYVSFAVLLFDLVKRHLLKQQKLVLGLVISGLAILYLGLLQYIFLPDTRWLFFLGWDDHYYRLISTFLDPGFTGIILILSFCAVQVVNIPKKMADICKMVLSILLSIGILLTYSRATYLAFIFVLLGSLFYAHRHTLSIACLLLFFLGLPFLPHPGGEGVRLERTSTVVARGNNISEAVGSMQTTDWIIGQGLFVAPARSATIFQQPNHAHQPDNWLVFLLTGTGLIGLVLGCLIIGKYIWQFFKTNVWLGLCGGAVLIHGLFNASLVYPFVILFFIVLVVGLGGVKSEK